MDQQRFDNLTRALASRHSRRRFLSGLTAGLLAATFGRERAVEAACPPDQVQRRGLGCVCKTTGRPPDAAGWCGCANGQVVCNGRCVDLSRDPANCGGCGLSCDDGDACTANSCDPILGCVYVPIDCDDDDVCTIDTCDPTTGCAHTSIVCDDGDACTINGCDPITGCVFTPVADGLPGACTAGDVCCGGVCKGDGGQNCVADADCCSGVCVLGVCAAACRGEHGVCDNDSDCCDGATCVWTGDVSGVCCASGTACDDRCCATGSEVCDAALVCCEPADRATTCTGRCGAISDNCDQPVECGFDCQGADPACCDTFCADLAASHFNCGECGNDCTQQGLGAAACCDGACRDLLSDVEHCGACDVPTCTGTEPACCGGTCRDLDTDAEHCGACFRRCDPSTIEHATAVACSGGHCLATACEAGYEVVVGTCCAASRACGTGENRTCCGLGETCCDGECVDTQLDPNNCAGCGNTCPPGVSCAGGQCSQGSFGEVCSVPGCHISESGQLICSPAIPCSFEHACEFDRDGLPISKDSCLNGECCIPPGVSCTPPGGNFTWSGVCCCDPDLSCPSVGQCP